jgi:hypothetical protein
VLIQAQNPKRNRLVIPPWTEKLQRAVAHQFKISAVGRRAPGRGQIEAGPSTYSAVSDRP